MGADEMLVPQTKDELALAVRAAARDRVPVFVTGGTAIDAGRLNGAVQGRALVISTRGLNRVVAYEPGDLTLTAECGLTIAAAQDLLGAHRQFVCFDPPDPGVATLGGVIASARDGPMAARFGPVRDQVLGLTVVNGDGRVTKAGGRVVKNVTGYDLCRLYTGSFGALGIVLEATVRVRPRPEIGRRLTCAFDTPSEAFACASRIREAVGEVASILVLQDGVPRRTRVSVLLAGLAPFVEEASVEVDVLCKGGRDRTAAECDPLAFRFEAAPASVGVALATPPSRLFEAGAEVEALLAPADLVIYDVIRGVRESWHSSASPFRDEARLDALLAKHGATLDQPGDPGFAATLASRFPSQVPGGLELMRSLKAALDPPGILNPGMTVFG